MFERDGHRCARCGSTKRLGLDHIEPVSKGGPDTLENLQVLCLSCNSAKGNRANLKPLAPDAQERLDALVRARDEHQEARREYLAAMVDARKRGHSYAEIARAAGISRQAAREALTR